MSRRETACAIAEAHAADPGLTARVIGFADGAVVLLRDQEEVAFRVLAECQEEDEEAAIGWSGDRRVWCVVAPGRPAFNLAQCRLAEEMHLFDGLGSPLAEAAGVTVTDRDEETLEDFAERPNA